MKLSVDSSQRQAKMRAHTATHLLHFWLGHVLWSTKQAGSLVEKDYLRFDFAANTPLLPSEILQIEWEINQWIYAWYDVVIRSMSLDEAKDLWAKAFFEDKYGDEVRVVSILNHSTPSGTTSGHLHSIELCGGTHVHNTSHIWAFKIIGQEAVASWIRRIIALTGPKVTEEIQRLEWVVARLSQLCDCQPKQVEEKLTKLLNEKTQLEQQLAGFQTAAIAEVLYDADKQFSNTIFDPIINISQTSLSNSNFKEIVNQAKSLWCDKNRLLYKEDWTFALWSTTFSAKEFAKEKQLRWGGSPTLVQGKDVNILQII